MSNSYITVEDTGKKNGRSGNSLDLYALGECPRSILLKKDLSVADTQLSEGLIEAMRKNTFCTITYLILAFLLLSMLAFLVGVGECAQSTGKAETDMKADIIVNILRYVEWPNSVEMPGDAILSICVLGDDMLATSLERYHRMSLNGKKLVIEFLKKPRDIYHCNAVYVGYEMYDRIIPMLSSLAGKRIMSIADAADFHDQGGMIGVGVEGQNAKISINYSSVRFSGLIIRSRLLRHASTSE